MENQLNGIIDLPLSEIMHKNVICLTNEDTVDKAVQIFENKSFHHIPVIDQKGVIIGIISTSDLDKFSWGKSFFVNKQKKEMNSLLYETYRTVDIMTQEVFTLHPDQTVGEAIRVFKSGNFRAIPICDGDSLEGIVTPIDILHFILIKSS
jgi:acetoin utilization protein AcuB